MRHVFIPIVLVATLISGASCSWFHKEETAVKVALIDCAKQNLGQTVAESGMSLLLDVISIIAANGTNYEAELTVLETKFGPEAIACAEHVAEAIFRPAAPAADATPEAKANARGMSVLHDRATKLLVGKSFK